MRRKVVLGALVGAVLVLATGCGSSSSQVKKAQEQKTQHQKAQEQKAYAPHIDSANFTTTIDNKFFPLEPGTTFFYQGSKRGSTRDELAVTSDTKKVMGVECVVVDDKGWERGKLIEGTFDYYAQDKQGNVWYFGEDTKEYENGKVVSTKGSWEAGVDGAKPGIIMQSHPKVGQSYRQEYYKGEAEDMAKVVSSNESVAVPYGSFDRVLKTEEWTPLEPGYVEHKYYAPGVGQVYGGGLELVDVKHS